jgi:acyl-[acyl-carrier-protein] desaturase
MRPYEPKYDQTQMLAELEPEAERLLNRHLVMTQEWFPHDFIPYSEGRDFDKEPWTPDQPRLDGPARTAFFVNLLTEDNLPSYHREVYRMFGQTDSAWRNWVHRWTAEEGRHAIVLRDYLVVTRNIDPVALERGRMQVVEDGYETGDKDTLRGMAYVAFQELATRISHRNTGRYSGDPVADRIMARISADENLHMVFYRDVLTAAMRIDPSAVVEAVTAEVVDFEMPGAVMNNFRRMSVEIADAGIYDLRIHHDDIVWPLLRHLRIFDATGLTPEAEQTREGLGAFLDQLDAQASRYEDKRAQRHARRAQQATTSA